MKKHYRFAKPCRLFGEILVNTLSYSKLYTYRSCRQKFYFQYIEKLATKPSDLNFNTWRNFARGSAIHKHLECSLRGEPWSKGISELWEREERSGMTEEARKEMSVIQASAKEVGDAASAWFNLGDWEPLEIDGVKTIEYKITAPLGSDAEFLGYIDLVAKHRPTGLVFIIDFKSRNTFASDNSGIWDLQLAAYQHALLQKGIKVHGTALLEIKPEPPKRARYKREDSGSFLTVRLSECGSFRWTPTFRSEELLSTLWANLEREAASIWKAQRDPVEIFVNTSAFNCGSCKYSRLCMAKLNGEDAEHVQNASFEVTE